MAQGLNALLALWIPPCSVSVTKVGLSLCSVIHQTLL